MDDLFHEKLNQILIEHEGMRDKPYQDTKGIWTVGVGHNMNVPLSRSAILHILEDDKRDAINDCLHHFPWFADLDDTRKMAMISLRFNLGLGGLLGFRKFLYYMEMGHYTSAADELLYNTAADGKRTPTKWSVEVKAKRANDIANMIRGSAQV